LMDEGKYDEAAETYKQILRNDKNNVRAKAGLENVQRAQAAERQIASIRANPIPTQPFAEQGRERTPSGSSGQSPNQPDSGERSPDQESNVDNRSGMETVNGWADCVLEYNRYRKGSTTLVSAYIVVLSDVFPSASEPFVGIQQGYTSKRWIDSYFSSHPEVAPEERNSVGGNCAWYKTQQDAVNDQMAYENQIRNSYGSVHSGIPTQTVHIQWRP